MNTVTFSIKDSFIGIIKLNRPDARNAMSKQLLQDFHLALDEVEKNKNLRVLIITGEGKAEEHTSELQSRSHLVCRLLLERRKISDLIFIDICNYSGNIHTV